MKVILKENVKNLGMVGSIVDVKPGYARNFLVPHRLAEIATEGAIKNCDNLTAELTAQIASSGAEAQRGQNRLQELAPAITKLKEQVLRTEEEPSTFIEPEVIRPIISSWGFSSKSSDINLTKTTLFLSLSIYVKKVSSNK